MSDWTNDTPQLSDLTNFGLIIITKPILTYKEKSLLEQYLDNGGRLLVISDSMGRLMGNDLFYKNYLSTSYNGISGTNTVLGVKGDPISDGLFFNLLSNGEIITQNDINTTSKVLEYFGQGEMMQKKNNGIYSVVYMSNNVSSINDNATIDLLFSRIMKWFNIDITPPVITVSSNNTYPINTTNILLS